MYFLYIDSGNCFEGDHWCELTEHSTIESVNAYLVKKSPKIEADASVRLIKAECEIVVKLPPMP